MSEQHIYIPVRLNAGTFRRFSAFDTLSRQKKWVRPAVFALILGAFSAVCFALRSRTEDALTLGILLLVIALGLPAAYFLSYFLSVNRQIIAMKLEKPREVYTLSLDSQSVEVNNQKERASYEWSQFHGAWRVKGCIYLYVTPTRAFLLPNRQSNVDDDSLWELITSSLASGKTVDMR